MKRRLIAMGIVMALFAIPLAASAHGTEFTKEEVPGGVGWSCPDGSKIEDPETGTYQIAFDGHLAGIKLDIHKGIVEFETVESKNKVVTVLVKGGPNAMYFDFGSGVTEGTVHTPINPNNGKYYGVSNICFMTDKKYHS